jgi:hypothetical protein
MNATKVILPIVLVQLEVEQKIQAHLNIWKPTFLRKRRIFARNLKQFCHLEKFGPK